MYTITTRKLILPVLSMFVLLGTSCSRNNVDEKLKPSKNSERLDSIKKVEEPKPEPELIVNYKIDTLLLMPY